MDQRPARGAKTSDYATTSNVQRGKKLCDGVYSFYEPKGLPEAEIVFIHGLQLAEVDIKNAYSTTWFARDGTEDNCWPMTWLPEKFPNVRILSLSYDASLLETPTTGRMDSYLLGESLVQEITLRGVDIGQKGCPVVFVGHGLGGLIAKQIVISGHHLFSTDERVCKLLRNVKAFFFYSTHHGGSKLAEWSSYIPFLKRSPLVKYLQVLNAEAGRLNSEFEQIRQEEGGRAWKFYVVGEMHPTSYFKGFLSAMVVEEASARHVGYKFIGVAANHKDVCKPESETDTGFQYLTNCIKEVLEDNAKNHGQLLELPSFSVGIKDNLQEVKKKMAEHSIVGLVGMGGIGKTTLSKHLYNQEKGAFERCCFLDDVKSQGIDKCRRQLFHDLCGEEWKENGNLNLQMDKIKRIILMSRVLLVVDDVNDEKYMNDLLVHAFNNGENGSKVIVTTRLHDVLSAYREGILDVELLKDKDASELFSFYAFRGVAANERMQLDSQAKAIISTCGKLPLSLEVIGQYVEKRNYLQIKERLEIWEEALMRLRTAKSFDGSRDGLLWSKLKISYDGLDEKEQSMFLDFACIMCETSMRTGQFGVRKDWFVRILDDCSSVQNLINRSLLKWNSDKEGLVMHDQLRDMGRSIVRKEDEKRSRVWEKADLRLTLQEESYKILEGLILNGVDKLEFDRQLSKPWMQLGQAKYFQKLRLLNLTGSNLEVVQHYLQLCSEQLKWLCLDRTEITIGSIQNLELFSQLRVLEMNYCLSLDELPTSISKLSSLMELRLSRCKFLKTLPNTIGNLKCLQVLDISSCRKLINLPDSIGGLQCMRHFQLYESRIKSLPESLGQLSNLEELDLEWCRNLKGLPDSLGGLQRMQHLNLGMSRIESLPESLGQLSNLEKLNLWHCKNLKGLPDSLGGLHHMQHLNLGNSGIESLPESLGQLSNLEKLDLSLCFNLKGLPDSPGGLQHMRHLKLGYSGVESLPESLGQLSNLEELNLRRCKNLKRLPSSLGGLQRMGKVKLKGSGIESQPWFWNVK